MFSLPSLPKEGKKLVPNLETALKKKEFTIVSAIYENMNVMYEYFVGAFEVVAISKSFLLAQFA